jgi:hypothetical protein
LETALWVCVFLIDWAWKTTQHAHSSVCVSDLVVKK